MPSRVRRISRRRKERTTSALDEYWQGNAPPPRIASAEESDEIVGVLFFADHKKPAWAFDGSHHPFFREWCAWAKSAL